MVTGFVRKCYKILFWDKFLNTMVILSSDITPNKKMVFLCQKIISSHLNYKV